MTVNEMMLEFRKLTIQGHGELDVFVRTEQGEEYYVDSVTGFVSGSIIIIIEQS